MPTNAAPQVTLRFQFLITISASLISVGLLLTASHAANVSVTGASGTNGTSGFTGDGTNGGNGGDATSGGDATAVDNDGGETDNRAFATGGRGGTGGNGGIALGAFYRGGDGGDGGWGGDANAVAITSGFSPGLVNALAIATGGIGGDGGIAAGNQGDLNYGSGGVPGNGGDAHGSASATNIQLGGRATAAVSVSAGHGGSGSNRSPGLNGADGGIASIDSVFASANNGRASASAHVTGGTGGTANVGGIGGAGGSLALVNQVGGSTTGALDLEQTAIGGSGGAGSQGSAGIAGTATSWLTLTDSAASSVFGVVSATGGHGGLGDEVGGDGADADADVDITGNGTVTVEAYSAGGNAGDGDVVGIRGLGTATAHATTPGGFVATARADASGRLATAASRSDTSGGAVNSMSLSASATNHSDLTTETVASVGGDFSATTTGFRAKGNNVGLPSASIVTSQLSGDPNVTSAYNPPGGHTPLALLAMGLNTSNTLTGTPTLSVSADYSFDVGMLTGGKLMIGLLDPSSAGPGFTSLHFTIEREGATVENQTFTTLASAMTYFDDHVLDLGAMLSGVSGALDLSISLAMISPDNNTRFGTTLLIADVGPTANPPGDYNDNNVVDAADYVVWRKNNNTATTLPNDTTSGSVNAGDYAVWRSHFGQSTVASSGSGSLLDAAVPEPTTLLLLMIAAAGSSLLRCRPA